MWFNFKVPLSSTGCTGLHQGCPSQVHCLHFVGSSFQAKQRSFLEKYGRPTEAQRMEVRSQFFPPCTELKRLAHMTQPLPNRKWSFFYQADIRKWMFHSRFVWYSWFLVSGPQKPHQTTLEIVPSGYLLKRTPISVADLFPATFESRPGRPTLGWPLTTIRVWLGRSGEGLRAKSPFIYVWLPSNEFSVYYSTSYHCWVGKASKQNPVGSFLLAWEGNGRSILANTNLHIFFDILIAFPS